ncbi:hypothetical protein GS506_12905 [Rhodococcus hoagii]|nr:hypothetical protein [Prescottella equi]
MFNRQPSPTGEDGMIDPEAKQAWLDDWSKRWKPPTAEQRARIRATFARARHESATGAADTHHRC